jgi:hypothetical protein
MMIKMLEMAAIEGSTPCSMAVNILMGSVVSLTFNRNIVTGTLSNEMMKENNPPATSPDHWERHQSESSPPICTQCSGGLYNSKIIARNIVNSKFKINNTCFNFECQE